MSGNRAFNLRLQLGNVQIIINMITDGSTIPNICRVSSGLDSEHLDFSRRDGWFNYKPFEPCTARILFQKEGRTATEDERTLGFKVDAKKVSRWL